MHKDFSPLLKTLDLTFSNQELLQRAFIHKSYVNEHRGQNIKHNERLEFLGDAVLELAATKYLFHTFPDQDEGHLTALRSALVKGKTLADVANQLNLGHYLYLSNGEEKSGGRQKDYILANLTEAVIGAIYREHGYQVAEQFIHKYILTKLETIMEEGLYIDSKSKFQELAQEHENVTPSYQVIQATGPDHLKQFTMGAYLGDQLIASGTSTSKQKAEQQAAKNAIIAKKW